MATYRFRVDVRCHLVDGETQMLRGLLVPVMGASSRTEARRMLKAVVTEYVHDEGGELTDAPMEDLELVKVQEEM